jgi:hypothetical protein
MPKRKASNDASTSLNTRSTAKKKVASTSSETKPSDTKPAAKKKGVFRLPGNQRLADSKRPVNPNNGVKRDLTGDCDMVITIENEALHAKLVEHGVIIGDHLAQWIVSLSDGTNDQDEKIMSVVTSDECMTVNSHCAFSTGKRNGNSIHDAVPILKIVEDMMETLTGKKTLNKERLNLNDERKSVLKYNIVEIIMMNYITNVIILE